jgi:hypothetical protein
VGYICINAKNVSCLEWCKSNAAATSTSIQPAWISGGSALDTGSSLAPSLDGTYRMSSTSSLKTSDSHKTSTVGSITLNPTGNATEMSFSSLNNTSASNAYASISYINRESTLSDLQQRGNSTNTSSSALHSESVTSQTSTWRTSIRPLPNSLSTDIVTSPNQKTSSTSTQQGFGTVQKQPSPNDTLSTDASESYYSTVKPSTTNDSGVRSYQTLGANDTNPATEPSYRSESSNPSVTPLLKKTSPLTITTPVSTSSHFDRSTKDNLSANVTSAGANFFSTLDAGDAIATSSEKVVKNPTSALSLSSSVSARPTENVTSSKSNSIMPAISDAILTQMYSVSGSTEYPASESYNGTQPNASGPPKDDIRVNITRENESSAEDLVQDYSTKMTINIDNQTPTKDAEISLITSTSANQNIAFQKSETVGNIVTGGTSSLKNEASQNGGSKSVTSPVQNTPNKTTVTTIMSYTGVYTTRVGTSDVTANRNDDLTTQWTTAFRTGDSDKHSNFTLHPNSQADSLISSASPLNPIVATDIESQLTTIEFAGENKTTVSAISSSTTLELVSDNRTATTSEGIAFNATGVQELPFTLQSTSLLSLTDEMDSSVTTRSGLLTSAKSTPSSTTVKNYSFITSPESRSIFQDPMSTQIASVENSSVTGVSVTASFETFLNSTFVRPSIENRSHLTSALTLNTTTTPQSATKIDSSHLIDVSDIEQQTTTKENDFKAEQTTATYTFRITQGLATDYSTTAAPELATSNTTVVIPRTVPLLTNGSNNFGSFSSDLQSRATYTAPTIPDGEGSSATLTGFSSDTAENTTSSGRPIIHRSRIFLC